MVDVDAVDVDGVDVDAVVDVDVDVLDADVPDGDVLDADAVDVGDVGDESSVVGSEAGSMMSNSMARWPRWGWSARKPDMLDRAMATGLLLTAVTTPAGWGDGDGDGDEDGGGGGGGGGGTCFAPTVV